MYDLQNEYRMHPYDAPSDIKLFLKSPIDYKRIKLDHNVTTDDMQITKAMNAGNEYDDYFCMTHDEFLKKYYIFAGTKPSDKIEKIVSTIFYECLTDYCNPESLMWLGMPLESMDLTHKGIEDRLQELITLYDYYPNWGAPARLNGIIKNGNNYFSQLAECGDKVMIDMETFNGLAETMEILETDSIYGPTIKAIRHTAYRPDYIEVVFQSEGYCDALRIKGKRDIKIINHKTKTIRIIDIKTAQTPEMFKYNYFKYRYDIQGDMYATIEEFYMGNNIYTILNPQFLVIFKDRSISPRFSIYEMTKEDRTVALNGGNMGVVGYVEGWKHVLDEIHTMNANNDDFKQRLQYKQNGNLFRMEDLFKTQIIYEYDNKR